MCCTRLLIHEHWRPALLQVDIHYCRARGTCDDLIWESAMRKLGVVGTALDGGKEGTARGLDMTPTRGGSWHTVDGIRNAAADARSSRREACMLA